MEFYFGLGMSSALKSSFLSDSSPFLLDDFLSFNSAAVISAAEVDFSSVDSFLDLSDDDKDKGAFLRQQQEEEISNSQEKSGNLDFTAATAAFPSVAVEFPLPQVEDFEDLEWLSRFVEHDEDNDSDSKLTFLCNVNHHRRSQPSDTSQSPILLCSSSPIPSRSRSKRTRLVGKPWGSAAVTLSISASSSSSSSSTISYGSSNPSITSTRPPKRKRSWSESEKQSRRCSHCLVEKTPQWRSGPLGAKTLCNACGVRYKSGRLFPEYRPACSPSFTGELHSNCHRKVLEMRRKKEIRLE